MLAVVLASAGEGAAEPAPASSSSTAEAGLCPCRSDPGARRHDGFFARSEPGVVFFRAAVLDEGTGPKRTGARGVGQSGAISIGGTPARGLVVGGTAWTARIDPVFVEGGVTVTPDDDSVKLTLLRVGPFVDWYPDPAGGFHGLASLAFTASIETDVKGNPLEPQGMGLSLATGFGYEWFVASEFSLGFVGRVAFGHTERAAPGGDERSLFVAPELALTATYH